MAADLPDLDDRTFEQIRSELLLRIPRYTPEWTDWNESDPGVTLIELFAWLAESIGYRLNQAPERCLLTFLDVLGIRPEPARPASTDLTFTVRQGETRPDHGAGPHGRGLERPDRRRPDPLRDRARSGADAAAAAEPAGRWARPRSSGTPSRTCVPRVPTLRPGAPGQGNALYLGFGPGDVPVTFPQQITFLVDPVSSGAVAPHRRPAAVGVPHQRRRRTGGALSTPTSTAPAPSPAAATCRSPGHATASRSAEVGKEERPLHWLRCRLVAGRYAAGQAPEIELLRYNTVPAVSLSTVTDEVAGQSNGRTDQVVRLRHRSVHAESVVVRTVPPPGGQRPAGGDLDAWSATSRSPGRTTGTSPST